MIPILYKIDNVLYCPDVIFDNHDKKVTEPRVAEKIMKHGLGSTRFEKNNGGEGYKDDVDRILRNWNLKCNLSCDYATNQKSKEIKIFEHAPSIREIVFLDPEHRNEEYQKFMNCLCSFTIKGNNKNDDAPDALAGAIDMDNEVKQKVAIQVFQRPF